MLRHFLMLSLLIFAACASTNQTTKPGEQENVTVSKEDLCVCMEIHAPVCGRDGKTYENSCEAECHNVKFRPGECR